MEKHVGENEELFISTVHNIVQNRDKVTDWHSYSFLAYKHPWEWTVFFKNIELQLKVFWSWKQGI